MKLEALRNNLVLQPIKAGNSTATGILIPETSRPKFEDGAVIISVGPDVQGLAVGDIVIRPNPPRYEITDDDTGETFWISEGDDVMAKMLPEPEKGKDGEVIVVGDPDEFVPPHDLTPREYGESPRVN